MKWLKFYFKLLDRISPSLAARKAFQLLSTPRIRKLRDFEEEILDRSQKEVIPFRGFQIQTYKWGNNPDKVVLMVHGWEGQAGNFGGLVELLLQKGYMVISYDAPSHGHSSKGKSNMFDIADLVKELAAQYRPEVIISHSFGSVVSAMTIKNNPDIKVKNWIMVTTPHKYVHYIKNVSDFLGISDRTYQKVIKKVEHQAQLPIDNLDMAKFCANLDNVMKATIIHSKTDKIIPINRAKVVHQGFPQSEFIELDQLGHYSILWSDQLKEKIEWILN